MAINLRGKSAFLKLLICLIFSVVVACHSDSEKKSLEETVSRECILSIEFHWSELLSKEERIDLQLTLGDELIEYFISEKLTVAQQLVMNPGNELNLFFFDACETKETVTEKFLLPKVSKSEDLLGYTIQEQNQNEK